MSQQATGLSAALMKLQTLDKLRRAAELLERGQHEIGLQLARRAIEELDLAKALGGSAWRSS